MALLRGSYLLSFLWGLFAFPVIINSENWKIDRIYFEIYKKEYINENLSQIDFLTALKEDL